MAFGSRCEGTARGPGRALAVRRAQLTRYDQIIAAYDCAAGTLAARYDALPPGGAFAAVRDLFPAWGSALDVGAGSGRDARWLRSLGFDVVAAEPAAGLRAHGASRKDGRLRWVDDRLPALDRVHRLSLSFDLITLSAVWQHVEPCDRRLSFYRLLTLLRPGGVLALTLRSGPAPPDRPMHPTSIGEIEALARSHGLELLRVQPTKDLQGRHDVTWTAVALRIERPVPLRDRDC